MSRVFNRFTFRHTRWNFKVLLCSLAFPHAFAQQPAENGGGALPQNAQEHAVIEEVIVTTSKREETLQEVLGSVAAFDGDTLQRENVQDFKALAEMVPGMVAQTEDRIAIRGIARARSGPSPVAFHVNGLFIAERGEPYYDLGAVEVLRGPSGTVFGRSATAGAINAKWRQPQAEWGAGVSVRYSSLEEEQLQAYLNIPFFGEDDPRLLGRFAAMKRRKDGTIDNLLVPDEDDPQSVDDYFYRMYLTSEPTDNLQLALRAVRYVSRPPSPAVGSPDMKARNSGDYEALGAQKPTNDLTEVRSILYQKIDSRSRTERIDVEVVWSLENLPFVGSFDVFLLGGEQREEGQGGNDLDGTEGEFIDVYAFSHNTRRSAELRFVSHNENGFEWLLGFFYYRLESLDDTFITAGSFTRPSLFLPTPSFDGEPTFPVKAIVDRTGHEVLDHSEAVFLTMDFDLQQLFGWAPIEITAGIRTNYDEFRDLLGLYEISFHSPPENPIGVPFSSESDILQYAEFRETTGELGARWFYSEAGMFYGKISRGYKPGLAQVGQNPDGTPFQNPVDAEFLNALEVGWKASFFDRSLTVNLAGFMYDYRDLQISQISPAGFVTDNAGSATINGLEAEVQWVPNPAVRITASGSWTDAVYDEFCGNDPALGGAFGSGDTEESVETDPDCDDDNPQDFSGERLPAAPEYAFSLMASYTFFLGHGKYGFLTTSIRSTWSNELDRRGFGNPIDFVESYSNSHFRLTYFSPRRRYKVEGFVENIEDNTETFFSSSAPALQGGTPNTTILFNNLPPRIYGLTLEANF